jgi:hypothetical protein
MRDHQRMSYVMVKVRFGVEGEQLDPDALASRIGVGGAECRHRGELRRPGLPSRFSRCSWTIGPEATTDWEPLLVQLLDRLKPLERFREAAGADSSIYVSIVTEIYGDHWCDPPSFAATAPSHHLSPTVIADLAAAGAALDIDEYIYVDDRPDSQRPLGERSSDWAQD